MLRLGVLDQSPVRSGSAVADAIHETLDLAEACDRLGYHRYWLAEHHSTPGLAGSSPEVLIGQGAAPTSRVRGGSGGGMVQDHNPPQGAQGFRGLEAPLPRPVDLGIGHARLPGAISSVGLLERAPRECRGVRGLRGHRGGSAAPGEEPRALHRPPVHRAPRPLSHGRGSRVVPVHGARACHPPARAPAHGGGRSRASARAARGARRRVRGGRVDHRHDHPRPEGPAPVLRAPGQGLRPRGGRPMTTRRLGIVAAVLALTTLGGLVLVLTGPVTAQSAANGVAPRFQVDPWWPKPLPNNWLMGQAAGVAVDRHDHVWVIQRPRSLTEDERGATLNPPRSLCCAPAPPVLEFDTDGTLLRSWGGPGACYAWPLNEHGVFVYYQEIVWIGGNDPKDHQVLKFTPDGKFLLQIGKADVTGGDHDTAHLERPANMSVDPATNELFVADGYKNQRVIIFDAQTVACKRH